MFARAGILSVCLVLLPLLAGCLQDDGEPNLDIGNTNLPAPSKSENITLTFYLLFPEECPEEPVGVTTYDRNESFYGKFCGNTPVEAGGVSPHCASFKIHDEFFSIRENDSIEASVAIQSTSAVSESEPTNYIGTSVRFTWRDIGGVVAEANYTYINNPDPGLLAANASGSTTAMRDSDGEIWLDIETNGHCWGVNAGQGSRFEVTHQES